MQQHVCHFLCHMCCLCCCVVCVADIAIAIVILFVCGGAISIIAIVAIVAIVVVAASIASNQAKIFCNCLSCGLMTHRTSLSVPAPELSVGFVVDAMAVCLLLFSLCCHDGVSELACCFVFVRRQWWREFLNLARLAC